MVPKQWLSVHSLLVFSLFFVDTAVAERNNYVRNIFELPEALKPNVEFWKNIYAKYSEDEIVIHDSEDLDIVYEVVNLKSLFKGVEVSHRLQWKKIELIKKQYRAILRDLARRRDLDIAKLNGKERFVASLFGKNLNGRRLRRAARNVRAQNGLKERFKRGLERSGRYIRKMEEIFSNANLPLELLALPHVESSFNYKAYSKFGAAGVWQFTRSTGRMYMKIDYAVDERLDPIIATESAAKLLGRNYRELKSWPLAITAYNHGFYGMKRAKRKFGDDIAKIVRHYRSRSFGFASRNFYSEFLAALEVSTNYRQYFGEVEFEKPQDYIVFDTPDFIPVKTLLQHADISLDEFKRLNPALRSPVLQSRRRIPRDFRIRIPFRDHLDMKQVYAKISAEFKYDHQVRPDWHKVRSGEKLSVIARRYRVSVRELMELNDIRNPHLIYAGQNLQIPSDQGALEPEPRLAVKVERAKQFAEATDLESSDRTTVLDVPRTIAVTRTVPKEDETVATDDAKVEAAESTSKPDVIEATPRKLRADVESSRKALNSVDIQEVNTLVAALEHDMEVALPEYHVELTRDMRTRVVRTSHKEAEPRSFRDLPFPQNGQVLVEPDETLGHFADWLGVSTQRIRAINHLSYSQPIRIEQPLWLTFENVTPEEFHRRRLEYHQGIEEDFYRNFSIEGEKTHIVKRGENIWYLCMQVFEMPYWLIKQYNAERDLLHLRAGEDLVIPIVEPRLPSD